MNKVELLVVLTHPPDKVRTARPLLEMANLPILCSSGQHVSELHMYHFYFFTLCLHVFHVQFCCFRIGRSSARNYRVFKKKSISYFMSIMYKRIFLNFGVILFMNKRIVSFC